MTEPSPLLAGSYDQITFVGNADGTVQVTATREHPFRRVVIPAAKDVEIANGAITFTPTTATAADLAWSKEVEL